MSKSFFDAYFDFVKDGECPLFYHRWSVLTGVGALLGRQFYLPFGHSNVHTNMYTMLIGNPGTRKSTGISIFKKLMQAAGYNTLSANRTTKEKFLIDLEGKEEFMEQVKSGDAKVDMTFEAIFGEGSAEARELFIVADEFADFIGHGNVEFINLLTTLWDNLPKYESKVKNSRSVEIHEPTISILSGNTPENFAAAFPVSIIGQGFLSRLLLIYGEPTGKKIAFPKQPCPQTYEILANKLREIKTNVAGPASITPDAEEALTEIYENWEELDDLRFRSYGGRRFQHLLKVCLICAALRVSTTISLEDVVLANTILTYTEGLMPKALGEFGKSKNSEVTQKIMEALYTTTKPLSTKELWALVMHDLEKIQDLAGVLQNLQHAEKIFSVDTPCRGFLAKKKPLRKQSRFLNFNLMQEVVR